MLEKDNLLGNAVPVGRADAMHEGCEGDGAGGSGHILVNYDRESSVVMTELYLAPCGSGTVNTVVVSVGRAWVKPPINRRGRHRVKRPIMRSRRFVL